MACSPGRTSSGRSLDAPAPGDLLQLFVVDLKSQRVQSRWVQVVGSLVRLQRRQLGITVECLRPVGGEQFSRRGLEGGLIRRPVLRLGQRDHGRDPERFRVPCRGDLGQIVLGLLLAKYF